MITLTKEQVCNLLDYDPDTGIFRWKVTTKGKARKGAQAGTVRKDGYRSITLLGHRCLAHRLAWLVHYGVWPEGEIDHRDRNPDHQWIANLRSATHIQNMRNGAGRLGRDSAYRGVSKYGPSWRARIRIDKKERYIGAFSSEMEAARAYDSAARQYHGEFACLNFPDEVAV